MFPLLEHIRIMPRKSLCGAHKSARLFLPLPPREPPGGQCSESVRQRKKRGFARENGGKNGRKSAKCRPADARPESPPLWRKPIPQKAPKAPPRHDGAKKVFAKKLTFKSLLKISTQFNFCWKAARKCCRVFFALFIPRLFRSRGFPKGRKRQGKP